MRLRSLAAASLAGFGLVLAVPALWAAPSGNPMPDTVDGGTEAIAVGSSTLVASALPLPVDSKLAGTRTRVAPTPSAFGWAAVVGSDLAEIAAPTAGGNSWCYSNYPAGPGQFSETSCGGPSTGNDGTEAAGGNAKTSSKGSDDLRDYEARAAARASSAAVPGARFDRLASDSATFYDREAGAMVSTARTVLEGVSFGPALSIDSLVVETKAIAGGVPGEAKTEVRVEIRGASSGGQPVSIGPDGVKVADQQVVSGKDSAAAQAAVNEALKSAGYSVSAAGPPKEERSEDGGHAAAFAQGLFVRFAPPVPSPVEHVYVLGTARSEANVAFPDALDDSLEESFVPSDPATDLASLPPSPATGSPSIGGGSNDTGGAPAAISRRSAEGRRLRLLPELPVAVADRLGAAYASLLGAALIAGFPALKPRRRFRGVRTSRLIPPENDTGGPTP